MEASSEPQDTLFEGKRIKGPRVTKVIESGNCLHIIGRWSLDADTWTNVENETSSRSQVES